MILNNSLSVRLETTLSAVYLKSENLLLEDFLRLTLPVLLISIK